MRFLLLVLVCFSVSCTPPESSTSSSGSTSTETLPDVQETSNEKPSPPLQDTEARAQPADVLEAFYDAANKGNYEVTKQYLSQESLRYLEGDLGALVGGLKGIMDKYTRNGTLLDIEVGEVLVRGEGASCTVSKHFRHGNTEELPIEFIKENGHWKIAWSTPTL